MIKSSRIIIAGLFITFLCTAVNGQELSIFSGRNLWHSNNLCDFNNTGCDWNQLHDGTFIGYAYHPNGELWLILADFVSIQSEIINIYKLNILNCQYTKIYSIALPRYWHRSGLSANIDYLGRIYFCSNQIDSVTLEQKLFLTRITNLSNPIFESLFSFVNSDQFHEIHFQNGRVYMPDFDSPLIRVYDTNFVFQHNIPTSKHISGLTGFSFGCDSILTYAINLNLTTDEVQLSGPDSIVWLSHYDLETGTLNPICSYNLGIKSAVVRLTSPLEFLSSDPECDLLIDLDRDNSTGVYPYDYLDSNFYCNNIEIPICDEDTYIYSSAPLDSIRLVLSRILDSNNEILIMPLVPAGVSFIMQNDSTYIITSSNPLDSIYSLALRSVFYRHNGISHSAGIRTIIVQGFNNIKDGVKVKSYIRLYSSNEKFIYSTTCKSSEVDTTFTTFTGQNGCDSVVTTIIQFVPGDTTNIILMTCDPTQVDRIEYVHENQFGCDSLVIEQTSLYPLPEANIQVISDFNGYAISCFGEGNGIINAQVLGQQPLNYIWSNGNSNQILYNLSSGIYTVTVSDGNGCTITDVVTLSEPEEISISFLVSEPKCFNHLDGSIVVEQTGGVEPVQYSLNGLKFQTSNVFNGLGAGTYTISSTDANGCVTTEIIWINVPLEFNVDLGGDQVLMEGDTAILKAIVNVPLDSISNVSWSGLDNTDCPSCLSQPISPVITTTFSVSITSNFGCTDNDSLTVFIEYDGEVYVPNIFTPNGDGINDLFYLNGSVGIEYIPYFQIFDRWGNIVYSIVNAQPNNSSFAWDGNWNGKKLNPGVYAYKALIKFKDGKSILKYGDITLLR